MKNECSITVLNETLTLSLSKGIIENYNINSVRGSNSIVNYLPLGRNIILMQVYEVSIFNILKANSSTELETKSVRSFIVGAGKEVDNFNLKLGDEVLIMDRNFLAYLPVPDNKYTISAVRDYVAVNHPELVAGTTVALDKSRSKVGLNTQNDVIISPVSAKEMESRITKLKENGGSNLLEAFKVDDEYIQVISFYICPESIINCIVCNE